MGETAGMKATLRLQFKPSICHPVTEKTRRFVVERERAALQPAEETSSTALELSTSRIDKHVELNCREFPGLRITVDENWRIKGRRGQYAHATPHAVTGRLSIKRIDLRKHQSQIQVLPNWEAFPDQPQVRVLMLKYSRRVPLSFDLTAGAISSEVRIFSSSANFGHRQPFLVKNKLRHFKV
jgi:hypothetical protein